MTIFSKDRQPVSLAGTDLRDALVGLTLIEQYELDLSTSKVPLGFANHVARQEGQNTAPKHLFDRLIDLMARYRGITKHEMQIEVLFGR